MSREGVFRGIPVQIETARITERRPELFYYEIRYADDGWASNATLEKTPVKVNFWGTLICAQPIDFGDDDYLELSDSEMATFRVGVDEPESEEASARS